ERGSPGVQSPSPRLPLERTLTWPRPSGESRWAGEVGTVKHTPILNTTPTESSLIAHEKAIVGPKARRPRTFARCPDVTIVKYERSRDRNRNSLTQRSAPDGSFLSAGDKPWPRQFGDGRLRASKQSGQCQAWRDHIETKRAHGIDPVGSLIASD